MSTEGLSLLFVCTFPCTTWQMKTHVVWSKVPQYVSKARLTAPREHHSTPCTSEIKHPRWLGCWPQLHLVMVTHLKEGHGNQCVSGKVCLWLSGKEMVLHLPSVLPKMSYRGVCIHGIFEYCGTGPTFSHGQLVCGQSQDELLCPVTEPQTMKIILITQHLNPPSCTPINHWLPFWQQEQVRRSISESHSLVNLEDLE